MNCGCESMTELERSQRTKRNTSQPTNKQAETTRRALGKVIKRLRIPSRIGLQAEYGCDKRVQGNVSDKLLQVSLALSQRSLAKFERSFVSAILDLDANGAVIASVGECGEERRPVDVSQAGQLGRMP